MIPGMRDFFGKKLGQHVSHFMGQFSPVDLADIAARKKLATSFSSGGFRGVMDEFQRMSGDRSYRIKDWAMGLNVTDVAAGRTLNESLTMNRQWIRMGVPAGLGASVAFGGVIGDTLGFARDAGIHTGISATLGSRLNPTLGAAYAGWAGLNMLRRGNNFGPF